MLPVLMAVGCSREAEEPQESALYKHYAAQPELSVAQVCGFSLCDTVQIDVVLLQAESAEAWQQLKEEFAIADTTGTTSWLADREEPARRVQWNGQPMMRVIASHDKQAIGLYLIEGETAYDALLDYQLEKIKK